MENVATKVAEPQTALPQKKIRHYGVTMRYVDALIALCPVVIWSFLVYGVYAIRNVLLSVVTMMVAEFVFVFIKNRKVLFAKDATKKSLKEVLSPLDFLAPAISGTIFGLMVPVRETDPAGMVYFYLIVSALFGIILGKLVFGGTGRNIFNPAATAFVFMLVCFQSKFSGAYHWNAWGLSFLDSSASVTSSATALSLHSASAYTWSNVGALFFGTINGAAGETCKIAILLGLAYLLIRRDSDWRVVASFVVTFLCMNLIAGLFIHAKNNAVDPLVYSCYELFSGGVLFGVTYLLADPVTLPLTKPSRVLHGILVAMMVVMIRTFASAPEGMAYAVMMGNALACFIDYFQWSSPKWNRKWILIDSLSFVVILGLFAWCMTGFAGLE
ncbi:MAG: RnfABCDGE type electron transport complex subunit D [Erysipelotrichaceae bacterium]|nr:RnfABCDGE type electron transport complex subunit D [Erysipelotrichaceae bacterium]